MIPNKVACELVRTVIDPVYSAPSITEREIAVRRDFYSATGRPMPDGLAHDAARREWLATDALLTIAEGAREPRAVARKYVQDFAQWLAEMTGELPDDDVDHEDGKA